MRFPRVLPAHWYRNPALDGSIDVVTPAVRVCVDLAQRRADSRVGKDRYYTMARRVRVQALMKGLRREYSRA